MDIHSLAAGIYRRYTGGDNRPVLATLRTLSRRFPPEKVTVRVPLIPGYNDEPDRRRSETILREMGFTRIERFDYVTREDP